MRNKNRTYFRLLSVGCGIKIKGDYYIIRLFQCADMHNPALSSTTIYLWLISLTASKELSILLLKLLKCMEQSVYRLIHLGLRVRCRD